MQIANLPLATITDSNKISRNTMTPPQLTRYTPISDIFKPVIPKKNYKIYKKSVTVVANF